MKLTRRDRIWLIAATVLFALLAIQQAMKMQNARLRDEYVKVLQDQIDALTKENRQLRGL